MTQETSDVGSLPCFALRSLHIRNLRGLRSLALPENGMGWERGFPPIGVIAGANGSGKTTLLRCITESARLLVTMPDSIPRDVLATECRMDFVLSNGLGESHELRFLVGDRPFFEKNATENTFAYVREGRDHRIVHKGFAGTLQRTRKTLRVREHFQASNWPRLVFLPSDNRDLVIPDVSYKAPGKLEDDAGFVATWERLGPRTWGGSTMELLFSARWADLNAKEQGHSEDAMNFATYTRAFSDLTGGGKTLAWTPDGDLVVRIDDETFHGLDDLSSGERQALLLLAELRRRWRPGSLILVDELELHLHDAWQGKLLDILTAMQAELGGQVIITTQSHSMFEMAALGTRAVLGRERLQ